MKRARIHEPRFDASRWLCLWLLAFPLGHAALAAAAGPAPNLRLEWRIGGRTATNVTEPIEGAEGQTVEVTYRLRNVGGGDAFAVVLDSTTALGKVEAPRRLQPGPDTGGSVDLTLRLPLARGMRELCIEARLQTLEPQDPGDPNLRDNRICRSVQIARPDAAADSATGGGPDVLIQRSSQTTTGPHSAAEFPQPRK